jgi:hypothetical protein
VLLTDYRPDIGVVLIGGFAQADRAQSALNRVPLDANAACGGGLLPGAGDEQGVELTCEGRFSRPSTPGFPLRKSRPLTPSSASTITDILSPGSEASRRSRCDINTGSVGFCSSSRLTPPKVRSFCRECPKTPATSKLPALLGFCPHTTLITVVHCAPQARGGRLADTGMAENASQRPRVPPLEPDAPGRLQ